MVPRAGPGPFQHEGLAQSTAFREAALRSEVRRAYIVIAVVALVAVLVLKGGASSELDPRLRLVGGIGVGALFAVQLGVLILARWARPRGRGRIPTWFIVTAVIIESLIPTGMMYHHIVSGTLAPYPALNAPPVLAYGLMITLTTLRLRPWMCILAGAIAAAGYGGLLAYAIYGMRAIRPTTGLPMAAYVNSAVLILISGFAAAWVAREIRRHMEAALGEAEVRRQMGRIEQDLAVARSIQQALIPRTGPDIPGFDIAGWNRPADQTGGDYYDWQGLPDGNWIITLADVSGHGIGPAMVTAACRAYVRASTSHHGDLGSLTSRINRLLAADLPDGRFITMVSVLIDPRQGPLALLSAGHSPIVLFVGATGAVRDILPNDMPLAVVPDQAYGPAQSISMSPGDVLALLTDGFVEWARLDPQGRREEFGLTRLRESLRRHAALPAAAMIQAITADVSAFAGTEQQQDDLTMVIIRRAPESSGT